MYPPFYSGNNKTATPSGPTAADEQGAHPQEQQEQPPHSTDAAAGANNGNGAGGEGTGMAPLSIEQVRGMLCAVVGT